MTALLPGDRPWFLTAAVGLVPLLFLLATLGVVVFLALW